MSGEMYVANRLPHWDVRRTAEGWLASERETGSWGTGSTIVDAMSDLCASLRDLQETLEEADALAPDLQRQLRYLQSLRDPRVIWAAA